MTIRSDDRLESDQQQGGKVNDRYKWVALTNTSAAVFMSMLDGSIVIIAMPAIFRGIHLDPLAPGNIGYLLWLIMGYRLVQAVLVVSVGRLGDMYGRVRIYNYGFVVFTFASVLLSFDPFQGGHAAMWLIGWRILQAIGGSMLQANSMAIITDAFPASERGFALGINQVVALSGMFLGLVAGGLLASIDWRAIFWINVPVGLFGTYWAYRHLREIGGQGGGKIDWAGNLAFAIGLGSVLVGATYGIQPYHGHTMGWTNPLVEVTLIGGVALLIAFYVIERNVSDPFFKISLFRIRTFAAGNVAALSVAIARGGLQFILIIWLQGIWLPLHGYDYSRTPLWAGIFLLPLTGGFLVSGPLSGRLSDTFGSRPFAVAGMAVFGGSFVGLLLLPVDFSYWSFALLTFVNGLGVGMFGAPNSSSLMSAVPPSDRGVASGMRATFQNSGTAISIGAFFTVMIAGLAGTLPVSLTNGLILHGVAPAVASRLGHLPPVSSLFAATLGVNPLQHLLSANDALNSLSASARQVITGREFFPHLIAQPFHHGLVVVFSLAIGLAVIAAGASLLCRTRDELPGARRLRSNTTENGRILGPRLRELTRHGAATTESGGSMLYLFGFEKVGVVFGDLYFFSPEAQGEEPGAEHGVRLEVRLLEKGPAEGSEYGSRRITADAPLWRADILETIAGPVGSQDRTHHHPEMHNWNGGYRIYEPQLKDDPVAFVAKALSDLDWLLADSDYGPEDVDPDDARQLREAAPEICETLGRLIKRVQAGELGTKPPSYDDSQLVRTGWM